MGAAAPLFVAIVREWTIGDGVGFGVAGARFSRRSIRTRVMSSRWLRGVTNCGIVLATMAFTTSAAMIASAQRTRGERVSRCGLSRIAAVRLHVPLPELVVCRIVAVLVVEPVAVGFLAALHLLLFEPLLMDFVIVVGNQ